MGASVYKVNATGAVAIASTMTVPAGHTYRLVSITLHLDAAPTTSELFTVTLDAQAGAAYDTLLYSVDPAAHALVDLVWIPDEELFFEGGDAIVVAYANTDLATYGVQTTMKAV